ncbi:hypothetical protein EX30DRAFT_343939 [Ascodesmis nigricans]|uniref:Uncharacterized protein n=1 Tax=Ascodesmis nigricans TaxID=341454 RepID=A0A4S2ML24_9PEZI|nr:hypothetical protein EX30DRAFT_343939 [Ascodesmis nigricans]
MSTPELAPSPTRSELNELNTLLKEDLDRIGNNHLTLAVDEDQPAEIRLQHAKALLPFLYKGWEPKNRYEDQTEFINYLSKLPREYRKLVGNAFCTWGYVPVPASTIRNITTLFRGDENGWKTFAVRLGEHIDTQIGGGGGDPVPVLANIKNFFEIDADGRIRHPQLEWAVEFGMDTMAEKSVEANSLLRFREVIGMKMFRQFVVPLIKDWDENMTLYDDTEPGPAEPDSPPIEIKEEYSREVSAQPAPTLPHPVVKTEPEPIPPPKSLQSNTSLPPPSTNPESLAITAVPPITHDVHSYGLPPFTPGTLLKTLTKTLTSPQAPQLLPTLLHRVEIYGPDTGIYTPASWTEALTTVYDCLIPNSVAQTAETPGPGLAKRNFIKPLVHFTFFLLTQHILDYSPRHIPKKHAEWKERHQHVHADVAQILSRLGPVLFTEESRSEPELGLTEPELQDVKNWVRVMRRAVRGEEREGLGFGYGRDLGRWLVEKKTWIEPPVVEVVTEGAEGAVRGGDEAMVDGDTEGDEEKKGAKRRRLTDGEEARQEEGVDVKR